MLIQACGELLCLEAGVCGPLFQISPHLHICVTETWLSHCWHLCVQRGISLTEDIQDFEIPHHQDRTLMDTFLSFGYCNTELALLNQCRMFLKVIFVSDICNGQGTAIEQQFWKGIAPAEHHDYRWPRVHQPTTNDWTAWQRALTRSLDGKSSTITITTG